MSAFLQHAAEIFEAARRGGDDCNLALLIAPDGAIRVANADAWDLEALRLQRGAASAYRVRRVAGHVELEARGAGGSCVVRSRNPVPIAGIPGCHTPQYQLIGSIPHGFPDLSDKSC